MSAFVSLETRHIANKNHLLEERKREECILEPENIVCQRTHRLEGRKKDMQHICGTL